MCDAKEIGQTLAEKNNPHVEESAEYKKIHLACKKASNLIVRSLMNKVLRIVLPSVGKPHKMLEKLDERFDSKSTATKITKNVGPCIDEIHLH